jgi:hypothetical protein
MKITAVIAVAASLALTACSGASSVASLGASGSFGGCSAYSTQAQAQSAWEDAGKPARYDGDRDGEVCESMRSGAKADGSAKTTNCRKPSAVVSIGLSKTKYPHILGHMEEAVAKGWPRVLTLNRVGAGARRDQLLRGIPTKPGFDRDEWPAAVGRSSYKADVKYVESSENRSAGSVMGIKLRQYCDGTRFQLIGY